MPCSGLFALAVPFVRLRSLALLPLLLAFPLSRLLSQEHDDDDHDHDHGHLHFSHPIVTESPSPDTKIRLDYIASRVTAPADLRENVVRLEGEYAFNHSVSLAVVAPFVWRTAPAAERASGLGSVEVSVKAASLVLGERGILFGGGISAGLPTGDDSKAIGSGHIVEVEPFLDAGYKREALELVGFVTLASTFRQRADEEAERNLGFNFSTLYRLHSRVEALFEVVTERALRGSESGTQQTFVAPGLKAYPFHNRSLMFGASLELGTGIVDDTRALILSGFYHF